MLHGGGADRLHDGGSGTIIATKKAENRDTSYVYRGVVKKYRPDFLIRLGSGTLLVLEVKGEPTDESHAKQRFLAEWVSAVNADGSFGRWAWDVSHETAGLAGILEKHNR